MRHFILLFLCVLSTGTWAFTPITGVPYAISAMGVLRVDQARYDVECMLSNAKKGETISAGTSIKATFDCTSDPSYVYFEAVTQYKWKIYTEKTVSGSKTIVKCYLNLGLPTGSVMIGRSDAQWVCSGDSTDGSNFVFRDTDPAQVTSSSTPVQVAIWNNSNTTADCGMTLGEFGLPAVNDGWHTQFGVTSNCDDPTGFALIITTQVQYQNKLTIEDYTDSHGSDACSGPTSDLEKKEFFYPCVKHDNCYTNPWSSKESCDNKFHDNMVEDCDRLYTVFHGLGECKFRARLMFWGVQGGGDSSYDRDQQSALDGLDSGHPLLRYYIIGQ